MRAEAKGEVEMGCAPGDGVAEIGPELLGRRLVGVVAPLRHLGVALAGLGCHNSADQQREDGPAARLEHPMLRHG